MNESETNSPTPAEISDQIAALRHQVKTLLLALIVVSGTLAAFLFYQSRVAGKDIAAIKPQAMQLVQAFNQSRPKVENFVKELVLYGQTHPDFAQQVLKKYGLTSQSIAAPK